jgi:hypothetical protein
MAPRLVVNSIEMTMQYAGLLFIVMLLDSKHLFKVFSKRVVPCSPSFLLLTLFSSSTSNRIFVHEGPLANFEITFLDIVTDVEMSLSRLCGIYCFSPVRLFPIFPSFFLSYLPFPTFDTDKLFSSRTDSQSV